MLNVRFGDDALNLYTVGYLSADLHQLAVFAALLEAEDLEKAETYFGRRARGLFRSSPVFDAPGVSTKIQFAKQGSLLLSIAVLGLIAQIIMPIVAIQVQHRLNREGEEIVFEVDPTDEKLKRLLGAYQEHVFGHGDHAFDYLMDRLEKSGYSVKILRDNAFLIEQVVDRYAQRAVRTIKKYRR